MKVKRWISSILVVVMLVVDILSFKNIQIEAKAEEIVYQIQMDSMVLNKQNRRFEMSFPCDGYLEIKNENSDLCTYAQFLWNNDSFSSSVPQYSDLSEVSQEITAGDYYVYLYNIDGYQTTTVSYTFRPKCSVSYKIGSSETFIYSYYMSLEDKRAPIDFELPDSVMKGYELDGWFLDEEYTEQVTVIDETEGHDWILFPKRSAITYMVEYELNGGINSEDNITNYNIESTNFVLKNPTRDHYIFKGWYTSPDFTSNSECDVINSNMCENLVLYAKWEPIIYYIEYVNGGNHTNPTTFSIENMGVINLSDASKKGCIFDGWYSDEKCNNHITQIDTTGQTTVTVYAKWKLIDYSIKYELNGGDIVGENLASYNIETELVLNDPYKNNYIFDGWFLDPDLTKSFVQFDVSEAKDIVLYAKWSPKKFTISYIDAGKNDNIGSYTIEDEAIELKPASKKGYLFLGWYLDSNYTQEINRIDTSKAKELTLYAKWSPKKYTISYIDAGENDNISSYTVEDETIELKPASKKGYLFLGWYLDSNYTQEIDRIDTSEARELMLYAKWSPKKYTISYIDAGENDNISSYTVEDETIELKPASKKGYLFLGWYLDSNYIQEINRIDTSEERELTLYAKWKLKNYTIQYNLDEDVIFDEKVESYTIKDEPFFLGRPRREGYTFLNWTLSDGKTIDKIDPQAMQEDIVLYAKWRDNSIIYSTLSGSKVLNRNDRYLNFNFPTGGYLYLSNRNSSLCEYAKFYFDKNEYSMNEDVDNVSAFSGYVSAGAHYVYLYNIDSNQYTTITYKYNPVCAIYGLDGDLKKKIGTYELGKGNVNGYYELPTSYLGFRGYVVNHWYSNSECTKEITKVDADLGKDWYIYPKKEPLNYTIAYETNGGINNKDNPQIYTINDTNITLQDPIKNDYDFEGWYTTPDFKNNSKVSTLDTSKACDLLLYAKWKAHKYSIEYEGVVYQTNPTEYTIESSNIILKKPTGKKGYKFAGWYLDNELTSEVTEINTKSGGDITLYAKWDYVRYPITYELNGGVNVSENCAYYTIEKSSYELASPKKEGFNFKGWYSDSECEKNKVEYIDSSKMAPITLYAKWCDARVDREIIRGSKALSTSDPYLYIEIPCYGYLQLTNDSNAILNPWFCFDRSGVSNGVSAVRSVSAFSGYYSKGDHYVFLDACNSDSYTVAVSYTFYPICKVFGIDEYGDQKFIMDYQLDDAGKVELPKDYDGWKGYTVENWYLDEALTQEIDYVDQGLGCDWYIYALRKPIQYSINYDLDGGRIVDDSLLKKSYTVSDNNIELVVPQKEGYDFVGWYTEKNGSDKISRIDTSICQNVNLFARWKAQEIIHVHRQDKGTIIAAKCEEKGQIIYRCLDCKEIISSTSIPATGHQNIQNVTRESTCTEQGFISKRCRDCGKVLEIKKKELAPHKWNAGVIIKQPTGHSEGVKTFVCSVCGIDRTEIIPKKDNLVELQTGDTVIDDNKKGKYKVISASKRELCFLAPYDKNVKSFTIPKSVKINNIKYTVTHIGAKAFSGCKKLTRITIASTKLTKKVIAKNAFKGIQKSVIIKVPKKKIAAYKKLFKSKGLSSKVKIK